MALFKKDHSDEVLETLYTQLEKAMPGSEEALRIANSIESLEKAKGNRLHLSPDTIFSGLISIAGIGLILFTEGKDVFISNTKAWNNVWRPKN